MADANQLAAAGQAAPWLRILVEIIDVPVGTAVAAADEVLRRLDELDVTAPRLLHADGPTCWPVIAQAGTLGLPTRIGLEDTTAGADGSAVSGNGELVQLALQTWNASAPRQIAPPRLSVIPRGRAAVTHDQVTKHGWVCPVRSAYSGGPGRNVARVGEVC